MAKKKKVIKKNTVRVEQKEAPRVTVYQIWGWALLLWALYRYFIHLPEFIDEYFFKPIIFCGPVLWYVITQEKRTLESLGLTMKNFFSSLYTGLGFGFLFALEGIAANTLKYGKLTIVPIAALQQQGLIMLLLLSLATAFSEELLNRGFLFNRIFEKSKSLAFAAFMSSVLFVLLHVPILATTLHLQGTTLVIFIVTDFILGLATSVIFARFRSLVAPILIHVFWNMTVALYL